MKTLPRFSRAFLAITCILHLSSCKKIHKAVSAQSPSDSDTALFAKPTLDDYKYSGLDKKPVNPYILQTTSIAPEYEKKLADIPLPLGCKKLAGYEDLVDNNTVSLTRTTYLSKQQVYDFYVCTLEQMGWFLKSSLASTHEQLMIWEKPNKVCTVSFRSSPSKPSYFNRSKSDMVVVIHAQAQHSA